MDDSYNRRWLGIAMRVGLFYLAIGLVSSAVAGAAASDRMQFFWRLSAFIVSGVVFVVHIAYERLRRGNTTRPTAWHVAAAVALGGFALALAANIHDLTSASGYRPKMLIALIAWPLLTAVPAFIVALVVAAGLGMTRPRK